MSDKRRNGTRVEFRSFASLTFPEHTYARCETRDLSLKGVFVIGVRDPADGASCGLELCLAGTSSSVCLNMEGRVVRHEQDGIALEFTSMDPDSFFHLKNIIYYNSENPDDLEDFPFGG